MYKSPYSAYSASRMVVLIEVTKVSAASERVERRCIDRLIKMSIADTHLLAGVLHRTSDTSCLLTVRRDHEETRIDRQLSSSRLYVRAVAIDRRRRWFAIRARTDRRSNLICESAILSSIRVFRYTTDTKTLRPAIKNSGMFLREDTLVPIRARLRVIHSLTFSEIHSLKSEGTDFISRRHWYDVCQSEFLISRLVQFCSEYLFTVMLLIFWREH